jgi:hypothetical protein
VVTVRRFGALGVLIGAILVVVALEQGFDLHAAWYWWPILGAGVALIAAAWGDTTKR